MHYYPHNIGDFNNATRHLTRVERSVYREAIELYYDTEHPLTSDTLKLQKRLLCVADEEIEALNYVLDEFFDLTDRGYSHTRCDEEIAKYQSNISAKARAGIASAEARRNKKEQKFNTCSTGEQLTKNQEPRTKNQDKKHTHLSMLVDMSVDKKIAQEWLAVRNKKRLAATQTAFDAVKREAKKVGLSMNDAVKLSVENSWGGFKSSWLDTGKQKAPIGKKDYSQGLEGFAQ